MRRSARARELLAVARAELDDRRHTLEAIEDIAAVRLEETRFGPRDAVPREPQIASKSAEPSAS